MNFKKKNAANAPAPNQAQQAARRRSLRSGAYASVLAVVVLVLVILLNLVVGAVPTKFTQFDISTGKMFTLSDTTKTMLQELNTDVTAYYLAETGNEDSNITRILDRYAGESSHFTWQQRDPALYPTFAQQYDAQNASSSSVILVCGDNHTVVDYNDMYTADYSSYYTTGSYTMSFSAENALSSGIAKVTRENSYVLYQLTGHGEASLESDFTETLDNSGVTVQDLNLLTNDTVPEDAAALLINDPQADLSTLDAAAIKTYLENGGHLFVTTDLTVSTPNLDALLAEYGMTRQEGLVIENDSNYYLYGTAQTCLLPNLSSNEITAGVTDGMHVFTPVAQGIVKGDSTDDLTLTETNLDMFHAQLLAPQDAPAMDQLCAACGTPGGPDTAALLQTNAVLGDYAGTDTLQAAMGMLPMFGQSRLALALRAAGFGADGQGIVLAPPAFTAQYLPVRRFLAMALGLAKQRCASYHIWAALPLTPTPDGEELCAQYLASGLTLRAVVPLDSQQLLVFAAHTPVGRGSTVRRVHLQDPALLRLLERGGAVADFGWDKQGLVLSVRRME